MCIRDRGTTYQGRWDGWYGPDGRNDKPYNFNILYSSPTAKNLKTIGMELPTKSKVAQLREEAELKCSKPKKKSNCNPLQQVCLFNVTADPCEFDNLLFKVLCFGKHSKSNYYYMKRFRFSYFSTPM